jgi:hypothetical protein
VTRRGLAVVAGLVVVGLATAIAFVLTRPQGLPSSAVASVPPLLSAPAGVLGEGITLAPDGLGAVAFGAGEEETIAVLGELLGDPVEDGPQPCSSETDLVRYVRWSTLTAAFPDGVFTGWIAGVYVPPDSAPLRIATAEGVALGGPVADLLAAYGDRITWTQTEDMGLGEPVLGFGLDGYSPDAPSAEGIGGFVEGTETDGRVITFTAGQPCGPD